MQNPNIIAEVRNFSEAKAAIDAGADELILNLEYASLKELRKCKNYADLKSKKLTAQIPRIMSDAELEFLVPKLVEEKIKSVSVANPGALHAIRGKFEVFSGPGMNVFNSHALELLKKNGVKRAALSIELNMKELKNLASAAKRIGIGIECLVQGDIELMISRQCISSNLFGRLACEECSKTELYIRDEHGYAFPVRRDRKCLSHIFNSRELCMLQNVRELLEIGIHNLRFNFCFKDEKYIKRVLNAYATAASRNERELKKEKETLEKMSERGFTRAHYFRGVE